MQVIASNSFSIENADNLLTGGYLRLFAMVDNCMDKLASTWPLPGTHIHTSALKMYIPELLLVKWKMVIKPK